MWFVHLQHTVSPPSLMCSFQNSLDTSLILNDVNQKTWRGNCGMLWHFSAVPQALCLLYILCHVKQVHCPQAGHFLPLHFSCLCLQLFCPHSILWSEVTVPSQVTLRQPFIQACWRTRWTSTTSKPIFGCFWPQFHTDLLFELSTENSLECATLCITHSKIHLSDWPRFS